MQRIAAQGFLLVIALYSSSCFAPPSNHEFTVSRWKSAPDDERRKMAGDFLRKYDTKGMTLTQIKELPGEPDYGSYAWMYNLSLKGAPPTGHQEAQIHFQYPQLYVYFDGLLVRDVRVILVDKLRGDLSFDSDSWKRSKPPDRMRMAATLINSKVLIGRSKDNVREMLGDPDRERGAGGCV